MAIEIDATLYITDVRQITIERVPHKGLVRIKIKGKDTGFCDEMSLTVWGLKLVSGEAPEMPEIIDTTNNDERKLADALDAHNDESDR